MDNARIHHAVIIQPLAERINILFGPPYSPPLNPIEEIFALWKHYLRFEKFDNEIELLKNIVETAKKISPNKIRKAVIRSLTYCLKALCFEKI